MITRRAFGVSLGAMATAATATVLLEDRGTAAPRRQALLIGSAGSFQGVYKGWQEAYKTLARGVDCTIVAGASLQSLTALKRDSVDLAIMARDLSTEEDEAQTRSYLVARDYALMVVPSALGIGALKSAQLRDILCGQVVDWSALGGPVMPIKVITLKAGTRERTFVETNLLDGHEITPGATVVASSQDMVAAVASQPGAFGYVMSDHAGVPDFVAGKAQPAFGSLRALAIDDVPMTRATVLSGRYLLTRSFYLVAHGQPGRVAQGFIDFARGPQGQALVEAGGMYAVS
jgi:phosphate transport system substrate-binding protein